MTRTRFRLLDGPLGLTAMAHLDPEAAPIIRRFQRAQPGTREYDDAESAAVRWACRAINLNIEAHWFAALAERGRLAQYIGGTP